MNIQILSINKLIACLTILASFFSFKNVSAQLYPVVLDQRVNQAQIIIEGKVLNQKSYWDDKKANIYTANVIEVYKVFKGSIVASQIEIVTEGGTVGTERQTVSHTLELKENEIGIFMLIPTSVKPLQNPSLKSYKAYADEQGFVKYNLNDYTANDVFTTYSDIQPYLYGEITKRTKQNYKALVKVEFTKK